MKLWMIAVWLITGIACSDPPLKQPADTNLNLRLATTGASRFEDYIHTLNIYAFRKTVSGDFVYAETLAELDPPGCKTFSRTRRHRNRFPQNSPFHTAQPQSARFGRIISLPGFNSSRSTCNHDFSSQRTRTRFFRYTRFVVSQNHKRPVKAGTPISRIMLY